MIVGVSGLAGSGKDTLADFLVRDHGFVKISFADPMKRFCREIFNFTEAQLWGPSEERNKLDVRYPRVVVDANLGSTMHTFLTPRFALQTLGTEFGRTCFESIWVDYALRIAKALDGREGISYDAECGIFKCARPRINGVVIPDCRFANEITSVERAGGKVVRIVRPGAGLVGSAGLHASEKEMAEIPDDRFAVVLENTGTIERFRNQVAGLVALL